MRPLLDHEMLAVNLILDDKFPMLIQGAANTLFISSTTIIAKDHKDPPYISIISPYRPHYPLRTVCHPG
jgi:hypothetical protein